MVVGIAAKLCDRDSDAGVKLRDEFPDANTLKPRLGSHTTILLLVSGTRNHDGFAVWIRNSPRVAPCQKYHYTQSG